MRSVASSAFELCLILIRPPRDLKINMKPLAMKYPLASIFCLALAACGGGGSSSSPAASSQVPATVGVADSLVPGCTGTNCGAIGANTYSGTGIGVWRYNNTSLSSAATINVDIAGVAAGNVATLVFSNGSQSSATAPASGILASAVTSIPVLADSGLFAGAVAEHQNHDDAHAQMLEKNRAIAAGLIRSRTTAKTAADLLSTSSTAVTRLSFSPALGTSRSWIDNFPTTPVTYSASVQFVCSVPSGRNVVWWVDPTIVWSSNFTAALGAMQTSYCGSAGGLARLNTLLGDVWGSSASTYPELIKDVPTLQDVNVVLLNVPDSAGWAGYFFGGNNQLKTPSNSSNQALAFFINANQFKATEGVSFLSSTLLHESTHMVNFYQRAIALGVVHDTWLEETSAMMTEDIVTPAVVPAGVGGYNKILSYRLPSYLLTGGNVSYITWPPLLDSSPNYDLGGGFGAFLNRRYGLSIYQQLVTSCSDGIPATPALTSYACLDGLIKANGGTSFSDEFARFGATAFGQFPAVGTPAGYGYPSTIAGAYTLQAKDLSTSSILVPAAPLGPDYYAATSHTYQRDTIGAGKTRYVRNGVVVPANTSLMVIIK
jgi:hypothetical protein